MKVKLVREKEIPRYYYVVEGSPVMFGRFYPYLEGLLVLPDYYRKGVENTKNEDEQLTYRQFLKKHWAFWRQEGIKPVEYFVTRGYTDSTESIDAYAEVEVPKEDSEHLAKLITKAQDILEHHWDDEKLKLEFYRNECAPILARIAYLQLKLVKSTNSEPSPN